MATKPTVATVATGQDITATLWNNQVYNANNFYINKRPYAVLVQNTVQSGIADSTFTSITFDAETIDTDNQHSTVSNTSRVVIGGTLGWYKCTGYIALNVSLAAKRYGAQVAFNGTAINGSQDFIHTGVNVSITPSTVAVVQATVSTDYVELQGFQASGGAVATVVSGAARSYFIVEYVADLA